MVSFLLFVMYNGQGDPVPTNRTDRETQSLRTERTGRPRPYERNGQGDPVPTNRTDRETQSLRTNGQGDPVPTNKRTGKPSPYEQTDRETQSLRKTGAVMRNLWTIRFMRYTLNLYHGREFSVYG